jgi:hypothetical protein
MWQVKSRGVVSLREREGEQVSKIEHYEFMLKELNLSDRHRYWIERELAREQAIKEQTKEHHWLFHHNLIREGSE